MLPVIALVGRPNVGKSTLFNRLTRTRDAIVADYAGLTRDRQYGEGRVGPCPYLVIDTGGFEPVKGEGIVREMARQAEAAIAEADVVFFLCDARAGLTPQDERIARRLRTTGRDIHLIVNKAEGLDERHTAEFHELGLGDPVRISASHGGGVAALMNAVLTPFVGDESDEEAAEDGRIKVAVAGRPNVGKSTLINALIGEERLIAYDMPGTTRDAVRVDFESGDDAFTLIDTAGLRKKNKVFETVEKFSVVKTLQAIAEANVVILVLDAVDGITAHDAHIAAYALDSGRALVVAVNKWDGLDSYERSRADIDIERKFHFLSWARFVHISAKKKNGLNHLMRAVREAYDASFAKLPTPKLTRALLEATAQQLPARAGRVRPKLRYAHQGGQNPPVIVIHGNSLEAVSESYKRYLEGFFRDKFNLAGTPLRLEMKTSKNPYAKKVG